MIGWVDEWELGRLTRLCREGMLIGWVDRVFSL